MEWVHPNACVFVANVSGCIGGEDMPNLGIVHIKDCVECVGTPSF